MFRLATCRDSSSRVPTEDLARAARILMVRARREATGVFAGSYAAAFRGGGLEFEESRPYVPGDDVRALDWNAMARTGEPFVKRFRDERDLTLLLALDVSASMRFGTSGRSKAQLAAHAIGLLAAAAGRSGDRVGFLAFDAHVRCNLPPARGRAHVWQIIREAARTAGNTAGATNLLAAVEALRTSARSRAVSVLISDFRDPAWESGAAKPAVFACLSALSVRHDLVSIILSDPVESELPAVGRIRMGDPERPGRSLLLDTGSARVRERYRQAWQTRCDGLERALLAAGSDVLWLRTDRDPLGALLHFFRERSSRVRVAG